MTPAALQRVRLAVAKLCAQSKIDRLGLKPIQNPPGTPGYKCDLSGLWILSAADGRLFGMNYDTAEDAINGFIEEYANRADYPASLDACAQFERGLTVDEEPRYAVYLSRLCMDDFWEHKTHWSPIAIHASALQRCLALLKLRLPPEEFAEIVKD